MRQSPIFSWTSVGCRYPPARINESPDEERVVLHVDFWNMLDMTPTEVRAMQRVYELREMYLRAEGLIETGGKL